MKKILLIILVGLIGCSRQHIYHTYYGDINIDSIQGVLDIDGSVYYNIQVIPLDPVLSKACGKDTIYNVISFNPSKNVYFNRMIGNDDSYGPRVYFDPISGRTDSIR